MTECFTQLTRAFCGTNGDSKYIPLHELSESTAAKSLITGALENGSIKPEPIYGKDNVIAYEFLTCPRKYNPLLPRQNFNMEDLSRDFYDKGLHIEFDVALSSAILMNARDFPATLNIHPKSAQEDEFWRGIEPYLKGHPPQNIIFEILEHHIEKTADVSHLRDMKAKGYGVWLDDFTINPENDRRILTPNHDNRLVVFRNIYDTVKIDGPLIQAFMGDKKAQEEHGFTDKDLIRLMDYLRDETPCNTSYIAERVQNRKEADILFDMGFVGVQGFNLKEEDFHYRMREQSSLQYDNM